MESVPIWVPCQLCEDYLCREHGMHVCDCPCPPIDEWVDRGVDPYTGDQIGTESMSPSKV